MSSLAQFSARTLRTTRPANTIARRTFIYIDPALKQQTHVDHMPFNYLNKKKFTKLYIGVLGFGFALPWVAVAWRWYRPGGIKNP